MLGRRGGGPGGRRRPAGAGHRGGVDAAAGGGTVPGDKFAAAVTVAQARPAWPGPATASLTETSHVIAPARARRRRARLS